MHSQPGLACSSALTHPLCELPPLKPPLIMLGTVVQVFSMLPGTPWSQHHVMSHSLLALRHQIRYLFSVTLVGTGNQARASVVDLWSHDVCSDCVMLPVSLGPGLSWDSRRAFHTSPPNEFDSHAPSSRGLSDFHHDVLHVGPSTPHFSLPMIIMLDVFDDSVTDSLTDASSSLFDLFLSSPYQFLQ